MKRNRWWSFMCFAALLALAGCSGSSSVQPPPPVGSSSVSVTMTDTPPAGVTILSFEVTVTGAALNPGNVDLLGGKTPRIEVKQLETESAFLNTANVPAGTYTSLNLTFANPELTFKNDTVAVLAGCPVGAVCEIKPIGTLTSTFTFPGSGITIVANSPTGIQIDVNPNTILSATLGVDFSLAGSVSAQQLPLPGQPAELDELEDLVGVVQNLDTTNKKFTLHTLAADFSITTDNNTQFEFETCAANNFTCLVNGQVVEVDARIMAGGVFLAKKIEFEDNAIDDELEGIVFKIDDATHFEMVVLEELRDVTNVANGNPIVVTLSNPSFRVDNDGLTVPAGLKGSFEGATDTSQLLTGQAVQIRLTGPVTGSAGPPSTLAATTDRVRLRVSQFTAKVKAGSIVPPNFSVDNLPSLFTNATPAINEIHVQTITGQTDFEGGITGVSGLADGNTVSLRGLLFRNGANPPELIAKKVRKRS